MEIADGHLEYLFTDGRNIYRTTWTTASAGGTDDVVLATNYFFTSCSTCSPAPVSAPAPTAVPNMSPAATPPTIALPATSNFPTEPNYNITQYRIQAVDPMIDLNGVSEVSCAGASSEDACVETNVGSGSFTALNAASPPPAAYGPNMLQTTGKKKTSGNGQHSYFQFAAAGRRVPSLRTDSGTVTANVRRAFE